MAGDHAYVAVDTHGLQVVDISDPRRPTPVGQKRRTSVAGRPSSATVESESPATVEMMPDTKPVEVKVTVRIDGTAYAIRVVDREPMTWLY